MVTLNCWELPEKREKFYLTNYANSLYRARIIPKLVLKIILKKIEKKY